MRSKTFFIFLMALFVQIVQAKTSIVFRVDDFMFRDNDRQELIANTFEKYEIPLSVAWIPYDWKTKKADMMSDSLWNVYVERINSGKIDVMQHGCFHRNFKPGSNPHKEFENQTVDEQRWLIYHGKQALDSCLLAHGVEKSKLPEAFVFPCNVYDQDAIDILSGAGFTTVSANLVRPIDNGLFYYPCTTEDFYELESAADNLEDGVIIVMFHDFTFDGDFTFERLEKLLMKLKQNDQVEFITLRDLKTRENPSYNGAYIAKTPICQWLFKNKRLYLNGVSNFTTSFIHAFLYVFVFWVSYVVAAMIFKQRKKFLKATVLSIIPLAVFGTQGYMCIFIHRKLCLCLVALIGFIIPMIRQYKRVKANNMSENESKI